MTIKRRAEYYRITINGTEKTVLLFRNEQDFDKEYNQTNAKKWIVHMTKLINEMLNTEEWEYLGEMETYKLEKETKPLLLRIDE